MKNGPWRVVEELNRSVGSLERLRDDFEYKDQQGKDQVRQLGLGQYSGRVFVWECCSWLCHCACLVRRVS